MTLRSHANRRDDGWILGNPADLPELQPVLAAFARGTKRSRLRQADLVCTRRDHRLGEVFPTKAGPVLLGHGVIYKNDTTPSATRKGLRAQYDTLQGSIYKGDTTPATTEKRSAGRLTPFPSGPWIGLGAVNLDRSHTYPGNIDIPEHVWLYCRCNGHKVDIPWARAARGRVKVPNIIPEGSDEDWQRDRRMFMLHESFDADGRQTSYEYRPNTVLDWSDEGHWD